MRHHRSVVWLMTSLFLLGLAGCSTDATKSPSDTQSSSPMMAQAEQGTDQPASGEVQERAVPGMPVPRMRPGLGAAPPPILPPRQMAPGVTPSQPMAPGAPPARSCDAPGAVGVLPGEYAIGTYSWGRYLTAVNGGGLITEPVVRTDAQTAGPWEKFRLFVLPSNDPVGQWIIQTASKNCITAVDGGGRTSQVLHTDATKAQAWEFFRFYFDPARGWHTIQTVNLHFLTALGGGNHADPPAVHTDATTVDNWEKFHLWKCGDLGSGLPYSIWVPYNGTLLQAINGGGLVLDALHAYEAPPTGWGIFTLIQQGDGSYAIQTSNGTNYLTAIRGGGLAHGEATWDNIVTDRTQVQAWEKFRFIDQGDCTYAIQTLSGYYLGLPKNPIPGPRAQFSTDNTNINDALKFKLIAAHIR